MAGRTDTAPDQGAPHFAEVREPMRNGGGPACLRLRVTADPAHIDPRFLADHATLDRLARVVEAHWPETAASDRLADPALWQAARTARTALLDALELTGEF